MGDATLRVVVLSDIRKQAEHTVGNKPASSAPPWPLLQLLSLSSCRGLPW